MLLLLRHLIGAAIRPNHLVANAEPRIILRRTWNFTSKLLERLTLRLRNEKGGETTAKHEEGENLQYVVEPWRAVIFGGASGSQRSDETLRDDGTDLSRSGGNTVTGGPVACRETLSRYDEGCGTKVLSAFVLDGTETSVDLLGSEVEEELRKNETGEETPLADRIVAETHDAEEYCQQNETHELNWLATDSITESHGNPVTWNGTSTDQNNVTSGDVPVVVVHIGGVRAETDSSQNCRVVEADTVESNIQEEP